jgi:hypothetical protein
MQLHDLVGAQTWDGEQFEDALGNVCPHLLQGRVRTGLTKLSDHAGYRIPNAWDLLKPLLPH